MAQQARGSKKAEMPRVVKGRLDSAGLKLFIVGPIIAPLFLVCVVVVVVFFFFCGGVSL